MTAGATRSQIIGAARFAVALVMAAALMLGAGQGAFAQNANAPGSSIREGLPRDLPLAQPAIPPQAPPQATEGPGNPVTLPPGPGQTAVPFAPPPNPAIREQEALAKRLEDNYRGRDEAIKAMLDPTRIRLLSGYTDADEAFKALYANGLEAAEALKLTPGVALTREQVAALRKDIIWQVRIKKNGQELLVPRLYVANGQIKKN
jgi:hypothetical protein